MSFVDFGAMYFCKYLGFIYEQFDALQCDKQTRITKCSLRFCYYFVKPNPN
jgi:hypothetical protein